MAIACVADLAMTSSTNAIPYSRKRTAFFILVALAYILWADDLPTLQSSTTSSAAKVSRRAQQTSTVTCTLSSFQSVHTVQLTSGKAPGQPFSHDCLLSLHRQDPQSLSIQTSLVRSLYESRRRKDRHIAYVCREQKCGGLGDRIRGMTAAFFLAIWCNASFSVHMDSPVPWHAYVERTALDDPSAYPTDLKNMLEEKRGGFHVLNYDRINLNSTYGFSWDRRIKKYRDPVTKAKSFNTSYFEVTDFPNVLFQERQILLGERTFRFGPTLEKNPYIGDFLRQHAYLDKILGDQPLRTHIFLNLWLGEPTDYLRGLMEPMLKKLRGQRRVVGMHIRVGGMTVEHDGWRDPDRYPPESVDCFVQTAQEVCPAQQREGEGGCAVFYTSDARHVVETIQQRDLPNFYTLGDYLPLTHMDKTPFHDNVLRQNARSWVDWYLLANHCDYYLISRSGYSESASWLRAQNDHELYPARQMGSHQKCNIYDFRETRAALVLE